MRRTRRLILLLLIAIVVGVGVTYKIQRDLQARAEPPAPPPLDAGLSATASDWRWQHTDKGRPVVEIRAKHFQQIADPGRVELGQVELRLFRGDGQSYDHVTSAKAEFDMGAGSLYSDGDVEITMAVPADGSQRPAERVLVIRSSGVRFDSKTGKAVTERAAAFTYGRFSGRSVGSDYDPTTKELKMHNDAELEWKSAEADGKTMLVKAGSVTYKETEEKVYLGPTAQLKRGSLTMNSAEAVVTLKEGVIQLVEANKAKGADVIPERRLEYEADFLRMIFAENNEISAISGENNAKLTSTTAAARTTATARRVDMQFDTAKGASELTRATTTGDSVVQTVPIPKENVQPADTKVLRSEEVQLDMRAGGEEVEKVETHTPGTVEFVPNRAGGKHRTMKGERIWMTYAAGNVIQSFRSVNVETRTDSEAPKGKAPPPAAFTWSTDLEAHFDEKTGEMKQLAQWGRFRYQAGTQQARADRAVLDSAEDRITLETNARMWDETGSTEAERILLHQKTGDFEAIGKVASTRLPEQKKPAAPAAGPAAGAKSGSLLSGDEPLQARAAKMTSRNRNKSITYETNAILWQGANRLNAQRIDIDREKQTLQARGGIVNQLLDKAKPDPKKAPRAPVYMLVKSAQLDYDDRTKVAIYRGNAVLDRPGLVVNGDEIHAFLKEDAEGDTTLEKAFAERKVKIVQTSPERTRTGTGEHGEYYVAEEKVVLTGGQPVMVDSVRGTTTGRMLTWYAANDRLLVDGAEQKPAGSIIKRRKASK